MCSKTTCKKCDKPTWRGCGNHVEEALAGVPASERCSCVTVGPVLTRGPRTGLLARIRGR